MQHPLFVLYDLNFDPPHKYAFWEINFIISHSLDDIFKPVFAIYKYKNVEMISMNNLF